MNRANQKATGERTSSTAAVHGGEDRPKPCAALTTPIVQTSTYTFEDTAEVLEFVRRKEAGEPELRDEYGRYSNPTVRVVERKMAVLEGADGALLFSSGMCAITSSLFAFLGNGDHVVWVGGVYRRTRELFEDWLPRWGVTSTNVSVDDPASWEDAIRPETRLIYAEVPSNPYLRVPDLERLGDLAGRRRLLTVVDATFATPVNLRPLEFGIDVVLHSATKYLGGHNDLLAGVAAARTELVSRIAQVRGLLGGISSPHDAYLLLRGLKTLDLRVRRQNENGRLVAEFLASHPAVSCVYYPGLRSHPDHEIARRLMTGFGGVVSFEIRGGADRASRFIDRLQLPSIGPTLGGVESVVQQPALFISRDANIRQKSGLSDSLVRLSLGIEDSADIIADLEQALEDQHDRA